MRSGFLGDVVGGAGIECGHLASDAGLSDFVRLVFLLRERRDFILANWDSEHLSRVEALVLIDHILNGASVLEQTHGGIRNLSSLEGLDEIFGCSPEVFEFLLGTIHTIQGIELREEVQHEAISYSSDESDTLDICEPTYDCDSTLANNPIFTSLSTIFSNSPGSDSSVRREECAMFERAAMNVLSPLDNLIPQVPLLVKPPELPTLHIFSDTRRGFRRQHPFFRAFLSPSDTDPYDIRRFAYTDPFPLVLLSVPTGDFWERKSNGHWYVVGKKLDTVLFGPNGRLFLVVEEVNMVDEFLNLCRNIIGTYSLETSDRKQIEICMELVQLFRDCIPLMGRVVDLQLAHLASWLLPPAPPSLDVETGSSSTNVPSGILKPHWFFDRVVEREKVHVPLKTESHNERHTSLRVRDVSVFPIGVDSRTLEPRFATIFAESKHIIKKQPCVIHFKAASNSALDNQYSVQRKVGEIAIINTNPHLGKSHEAGKRTSSHSLTRQSLVGDETNAKPNAVSLSMRQISSPDAVISPGPSTPAHNSLNTVGGESNQQSRSIKRGDRRKVYEFNHPVFAPGIAPPGGAPFVPLQEYFRWQDDRNPMDTGSQPTRPTKGLSVQSNTQSLSSPSITDGLSNAQSGSNIPSDKAVRSRSPTTFSQEEMFTKRIRKVESSFAVPSSTKSQLSSTAFSIGKTKSKTIPTKHRRQKETLRVQSGYCFICNSDVTDIVAHCTDPKHMRSYNLHGGGDFFVETNDQFTKQRKDIPLFEATTQGPSLRGISLNAFSSAPRKREWKDSYHYRTFFSGTIGMQMSTSSCHVIHSLDTAEIDEIDQRISAGKCIALFQHAEAAKLIITEFLAEVSDAFSLLQLSLRTSETDEKNASQLGIGSKNPNYIDTYAGPTRFTAPLYPVVVSGLEAKVLPQCEKSSERSTRRWIERKVDFVNGYNLSITTLVKSISSIVTRLFISNPSSYNPGLEDLFRCYGTSLYGPNVKLALNSSLFAFQPYLLPSSPLITNFDRLVVAAAALGIKNQYTISFHERLESALMTDVLPHILDSAIISSSTHAKPDAKRVWGFICSAQRHIIRECLHRCGYNVSRTNKDGRVEDLYDHVSKQCLRASAMDEYDVGRTLGLSASQLESFEKQASIVDKRDSNFLRRAESFALIQAFPNISPAIPIRLRIGETLHLSLVQATAPSCIISSPLILEAHFGIVRTRVDAQCIENANSVPSHLRKNPVSRLHRVSASHPSDSRFRISPD